MIGFRIIYIIILVLAFVIFAFQIIMLIVRIASIASEENDYNAGDLVVFAGQFILASIIGGAIFPGTPLYIFICINSLYHEIEESNGTEGRVTKDVIVHADSAKV